MLELAVGLPLTLLLLFGVADFGRMFYESIAVNNAARTGVQWAITSPIHAGDTAGMKQAAQNDATNISGMTVDNPTQWCQCGATVTACTSTCADGSLPSAYVKVITRATFTTLVPYPGIPSSTLIVGTATMRVR